MAGASSWGSAFAPPSARSPIRVILLAETANTGARWAFPDLRRRLISRPGPSNYSIRRRGRWDSRDGRAHVPCGLLGHRAHAPMGGVFGLAAQDPIDQSRYLLVAVGARTSGPQFIVQAGDTVLDKAPAPLAHRRHAPAQTLCDGEVALALRRPQHQLGARHYRVRERTRGGQRGHLRMLFSAQHQLRLGSPNRHRHLSLIGNDAAYASKNYAS